MSCCASEGGRHREYYLRGKPCGRRASCGESSCLIRNQSTSLISCILDAEAEVHDGPGNSVLQRPSFLGHRGLIIPSTYRWHNHLTLESSSDTIVDTLWLSPACIDTHVGVRLVAMEPLHTFSISAYAAWGMREWERKISSSIPSFHFVLPKTQVIAVQISRSRLGGGV
jgi:hypothetical protein